MKTKVFEYEVKQGDTLGQLAYRYTGDRNRWTEILSSNPQIPKQSQTGNLGRGQVGQKTFVPGHFGVGQNIYLPYSWAEQAQQRGGLLSGVGEIGTVGASCDPSPVTPHPTAYYKVHGGLWESASAAEFGQIKNGVGDFWSLVGANSGSWPFGFYPSSGGSGCQMNGWKDGALVRVPKAWLDGLSTAQLAGLKAFSHLYFEDGVTKWTPAADVKPPECPAGYQSDGKGGCTQINGDKTVTAACDPGYVIDPATGLCIKGAATTVGAKEEGTKTSTILWLLLAAGAGIGGALLLNNLIKSRKVYGPPPHSAGALPAKGETVVRR